MIVACPACHAKYRVRDEAVPATGAEMKCPACQAVFVAHPPKAPAAADPIVEKLTRAKQAAEQQAAEAEMRALDAEKRIAEMEAGMSPSPATAAPGADTARVGAERDAARADADRARTDADRARADAARVTVERDGARADVERLKAELPRAVQAKTAPLEQRIAQLTAEIATLQQTAVQATQLEQDLLDARQAVEARDETVRMAKLELDLTQRNITRLEAELNAMQLRAAAATVPTPKASVQAAAGSPEAEQIRSLVAAVGPMLWGLEQSVDHLGAMAATDGSLTPHVQKLRLLQAVLKRLTDSGS